MMSGEAVKQIPEIYENGSPNPVTVLVPGEIDQLITFNIGGKIFQTKSSTLRTSRKGRLAYLNNRDDSYNVDTGEYFFDRESRYFRHVLQFYRTGELHPDDVHCEKTFSAEMRFWGLSDELIGNCCWRNVCELRKKTEVLAKLETMIRSWTPCDLALITDKSKTCRQKLWCFLDDPSSSAAAKAWLMLSVLLLITSVTCYAVNTLPFIKNAYRKKLNISNNRTIQEIAEIEKVEQTIFVLNVIDVCSLAFFTADLVLRLLSAPRLPVFVKSWLFVCDLCFLIPGWIMTVMMLVDSNLWISLARTNQAVVILQVVTVSRVFRVFRLGWYFRGFRTLVLVLKASSRELLILISILSVSVTFFGFLIYSAEVASNDSFASAFHGFWWAVITMSTVGYGQFYPTTVFGYIIGGACALSGIIVIGMPIPIIANNFRLIYGFEGRQREHQRHSMLNKVGSLAKQERNGDVDITSDGSMDL